ncbi:MAG TPA: aldo/keto reductase [Terriglobales bacterium]|nr:aldo/keto reductase [Terriglobales bacterium]
MEDTKNPALIRRDFLKLGGTAAAGIIAGSTLTTSANAMPPLPENPETTKAMPTRNLGKTGYKVGIFSLGGQASVEKKDNDKIAVPIVERALDLGVNYIDTAAFYGGGVSQGYIGQVMKRRRKEAFLATKTHDRTKDGSLKLLDESLKLLQTDHLDLWQLHNLSRMEELDRIFAKGGAIEALQQARERKIVRYLGLTGHADPEVLMEGIRRFPFDTVLMALNAADKHHLSFIEKLLPMAVEKQMGIIGMKIPARGRILSTFTPPPAEEQRGWEGPAKSPGTLHIKEAMYYVLSLPVSTIIIGCDSVAQLEQNVQLAREFTPLNETQLASLAEKTAPVMRQALFFRKWS